MCSGPEGT